MAKEYLDKEGLLYFWQKIKVTFVKVADYVATDNNFTDALKDKLDGIASGAEVNVQSDWNQTNSDADDYIKNKPTIPSGVTVDSAMSDSSENPVQNKVITAALGDKVPTSRKVNNKALSSDITLSASDVSAVPTTRKVNNKALSADITLSASDVSAIPSSEKGSASGVCPLDANGKVGSSYLPSYVDDVVEAYPRTGQTELSAAWLSAESGGSALTPEQDKIYILMAASTTYSANSTFRWSGSTYVLLGDGNVSAITNAEIDTILAS